MWSGRLLPVLWRDVLPPSSFLCPEDGDRKLICNTGKNQPRLLSITSHKIKFIVIAMRILRALLKVVRFEVLMAETMKSTVF
jgi:hypothetical protein